MFKLVVLSLVLAVANAKPSVLGGIGWAGLAAPWGGLGLAAPWGAAHLAAPLAAPLGAIHGGAPTAVVAAPLHGAALNYRGPVSLAPGQPANIVATDGRPLDTLSVNVDRALHYTARAVDHNAAAHILGKRSAPLVGAWGHAAAIHAPLGVAPLGVGHLGAAPLGLHAAALHAPVAPLAVAPWGGLGHGAHLGHLW